MKKVSKILVLVLTLVLSLSAIFVMSSSAADAVEPKYWYDGALDITGADRVHRDFTDETFDYHYYEDGGTKKVDGVSTLFGTLASPQSTNGCQYLWVTESKYGQVRSVTSPLGNTYLELAFRKDYTGVLPASDDYIVAAHEDSFAINDLSYYVIEFDMTTNSNYPGNIQILGESRYYNSSGEISAKPRVRAAFGQYSASNGTWNFDGTTFDFAPGEWVHITVVTQVNKVENEGTFNYKDTVSNIYVNGEFVTSINCFKDRYDAADIEVRQYYLGVGYKYDTPHTGAKANDSVALDNMSFTTFDTTYTAQGDVALGALFGDGAVTDITGYCDEIVWNSDYVFPEDVGILTVIDEDGTEYGSLDGVTDLKSALQFIEENELTSATIKLYANYYTPFYVDIPVTLTIDKNGFALQNGWEAPSEYMVSYDVDNDILTVSEDPTKLLTVNYYEVPFGQSGDVVLTEKFAFGRDFAIADASVFSPKVLVSGKDAYIPATGLEVYDSEGNAVDVSALTTIGEDLIGEVYSVYPKFERKSCDDNIRFSVEVGGVYSFYTEPDLWACAVESITQKSEVTETTDAEGVVTQTWTEVVYPTTLPSGAKITLYGDCTISKSMYVLAGELYLDLNGHDLMATCELLTSNVTTNTNTYTKVGDADATSTTAKAYPNSTQIFIYSSAQGSSLSSGSAYLVKANAGIGTSTKIAYYFGYENANTISENRMDISFGAQILHLSKGDIRYLYFANADLHNGAYSYCGLISAQQSRGLTVGFTDVNLFTQSPLTGSTADNGAKELAFVNTNVYGRDGMMMNYLNPKPTSVGNYVGGTTTYTLTDSKIFGMTFGHTAGDGIAEYTAKLSITMSGNSMVSAKHDNITVRGGVLVAKPETAVIDGVTYSAIYAIGTGEEQTAKFNVYSVTKENYTDEAVVIDSLDIAVGSRFATIYEPSGESFYDHAAKPGYTFAPVGYHVYDADGNLVEQDALTAEDAGKTYQAFVYYDYVRVSFVTVDSAGVVTHYMSNDISTSLGSGQLPEGMTVILYEDCYSSATLYGNNSAFDLNGQTFYPFQKKAMFCVSEGKNLYVYSSLPGAHIASTPLGYSEHIKPTAPYVVQLLSSNSNAYFGYVNAETKSDNRITVASGAFSEIRNVTNAVIYFYNIDFVRNGYDNYGYFNFRHGTHTDGKAYNFENCNIYTSGGGTIIQQREVGAGGTATFKNCNIYSASGSPSLFAWYHAPTAECFTNIYLIDTNIYGYRKLGGQYNEFGACYVYVSGDCKLPEVNAYTILEDENIVFVKNGGSVTSEGIEVYEHADYMNAKVTLYAKTYDYTYTVITKDAFKAGAFQNMSLDTNVVGNLYIPAYENIASAMLGETNILDTTLLETIGGKEYYVLSFDVAPKYGDRSLTLTVNFEDGSSVEFPMSVANYAKALLALDGTSNEYVADSQVMMKYILNYIKEVAVAFGGADATTIFADLGDISVDTNVEITEEVKDTSAVNAYVTDAALNLDAYAGFAFKVAANFVGTVKVELEGVPAVEVTYTAETPASESAVVVLENVPAHLFRGDVVITVTPAEGEVVSATFNLATYANANDAAYIKALYAYTVQAEAYNTKYPTVGTVD